MASFENIDFDISQFGDFLAQNNVDNLSGDSTLVVIGNTLAAILICWKAFKEFPGISITLLAEGDDLTDRANIDNPNYWLNAVKNANFNRVDQVQYVLTTGNVAGQQFITPSGILADQITKPYNNVMQPLQQDITGVQLINLIKAQTENVCLNKQEKQLVCFIKQFFNIHAFTDIANSGAGVYARNYSYVTPTGNRQLGIEAWLALNRNPNFTAYINVCFTNIIRNQGSWTVSFIDADQTETQNIVARYLRVGLAPTDLMRIATTTGLIDYFRGLNTFNPPAQYRFIYSVPKTNCTTGGCGGCDYSINLSFSLPSPNASKSNVKWAFTIQTAPFDPITDTLPSSNDFHILIIEALCFDNKRTIKYDINNNLNGAGAGFSVLMNDIGEERKFAAIFLSVCKAIANFLGASTDGIIQNAGSLIQCTPSNAGNLCNQINFVTVRPPYITSLMRQLYTFSILYPNSQSSYPSNP